MDGYGVSMMGGMRGPCEACGQVSPPDARFCKGCGAKLPELVQPGTGVGYGAAAPPEPAPFPDIAPPPEIPARAPIPGAYGEPTEEEPGASAGQEATTDLQRRGREQQARMKAQAAEWLPAGRTKWRLEQPGQMAAQFERGSEPEPGSESQSREELGGYADRPAEVPLHARVMPAPQAAMPRDLVRPPVQRTSLQEAKEREQDTAKLSSCLKWGCAALVIVWVLGVAIAIIAGLGK